jgi:hypothetical protein
MRWQLDDFKKLEKLQAAGNQTIAIVGGKLQLTLFVMLF